MKKVAIIQARTSSTRLPNKVLTKLCNKTIIENIVERVSRAESVDEVVIATSKEKSDDAIEKLCIEHGYNCYRGDLNNVLDRFYNAAKENKADIVIRLTGDNALVDPEIIDEAIELFISRKCDYLLYKKRLPLGMGVEVFSFAALDTAHKYATDKDCLEHVTPFLYCNDQMFDSIIYEDKNDIDRSMWRFTMDNKEDYDFVKKIYDHFGDNCFSYKDVVKLVENNVNWLEINAEIKQKEIEYSGEE